MRAGGEGCACVEGLEAGRLGTVRVWRLSGEMTKGKILAQGRQQRLDDWKRIIGNMNTK